MNNTHIISTNTCSICYNNLWQQSSQCTQIRVHRTAQHKWELFVVQIIYQVMCHSLRAHVLRTEKKTIYNDVNWKETKKHEKQIVSNRKFGGGHSTVITVKIQSHAFRWENYWNFFKLIYALTAIVTRCTCTPYVMLQFDENSRTMNRWRERKKYNYERNQALATTTPSMTMTTKTKAKQPNAITILQCGCGVKCFVRAVFRRFLLKNYVLMWIL